MRIFSLLFLVFMIHIPLGAQNPFGSVFDLLPEHIEGFTPDEPMAVIESDADKRHLTITKVYYQPFGKEEVIIKLRDFSHNPNDYKAQLSELSNREVSYSLQNGRPFNYDGFPAMERRINEASSWVIFAGEFIILELEHKNGEDERQLLIELAQKLPIKALIKAFDASRIHV